MIGSAVHRQEAEGRGVEESRRVVLGAMFAGWGGGVNWVGFKLVCVCVCVCEGGVNWVGLKLVCVCVREGGCQPSTNRWTEADVKRATFKALLQL